MLIQVKSCYFNLGYVNSGYESLLQFKSGYVRLVHVIPCKFRLVQFFRLGLLR